MRGIGNHRRLLESHVHFFERKWADTRMMTAADLTVELEAAFSHYGFTSVFDVSSDWQNTRRLRDRIESGEVSGPKIYSTGAALVPRSAQPSDTVMRLMGIMPTPLVEVVDAEEATAAAEKLLDLGVDGIKLFASASRGPPLGDAVISAVARVAHSRHKLLFVHPNSGADVLAAMRSGADIIAHTTPCLRPLGSRDPDRARESLRDGIVYRCVENTNSAGRPRCSRALALRRHGNCESALSGRWRLSGEIT